MSSMRMQLKLVSVVWLIDYLDLVRLIVVEVLLRLGMIRDRVVRLRLYFECMLEDGAVLLRHFAASERVDLETIH